MVRQGFLFAVSRFHVRSLDCTLPTRIKIGETVYQPAAHYAQSWSLVGSKRYKIHRRDCYFAFTSPRRHLHLASGPHVLRYATHTLIHLPTAHKQPRSTRTPHHKCLRNHDKQQAASRCRRCSCPFCCCHGFHITGLSNSADNYNHSHHNHYQDLPQW